MDLWLIFLTGLTVGGLTCLTVQGGLLASTVAVRLKDKRSLPNDFIAHSLPIFVFLLAKLVSHLILGFLFGLLGQKLAISPAVQLTIQVLAGVYMLTVALNLLNVHPLFRFSLFTPPRFLTNLVAKQTQAPNLFTPALLGLLTVFIPCGTSLAVEAFAISSANPFVGAAIMGVFVIGTMPLFFSIGYLTSSLGTNFRQIFLRLSAWIIIYLALVSINGALVAAGSPVTWQKIYDNLPFEIDLGGNQAVLAQASPDFQSAMIEVNSGGYSPNYLKVQNGSPVHLTIVTKGAINCASSVFKIPDLNISQSLPLNGSSEVDFTPTKPGKLTFTCPLGLYTGTIEVI
jgi:uncharacterized protein